MKKDTMLVVVDGKIKGMPMGIGDVPLGNLHSATLATAEEHIRAWQSLVKVRDGTRVRVIAHDRLMALLREIEALREIVGGHIG